MIKKAILVLSLIFTVNHIYGQRGFSYANSALSMGIGGAGVSLNSIESLYHNQAGLVNAGRWGVQLNSERRFSLEELTAISLGAYYKIDQLGSFGLLISNFGFDLYSEQKVGLAYARRLAKSLSIGLQVDMINTKIESLGSKSIFTFELGIQSEIIKNLVLGAHIYNPFKVDLIPGEEIPTRLRLGLKYNIAEGLHFIAEADKIIDRTISFKGGIDYQIVPQLNLRAGFSTEPGTFSFGLAYKLNTNFVIDGAYSYHENLGLTPGISLKFEEQ